MEVTDDIIIAFHKHPKTGLTIRNTFLSLKKAGYKVTLSQVDKVVGHLNEKPKTEQKDLFLQTVAGNMTSYQADIFNIKQKGKLLKFVALINVETRKAYVYYMSDLKTDTVVSVFNKWMQDVPDGQKPLRISTDLGSEFNSKKFYNWLETKNIQMFYINKSDYKTTYATAIVDRFIRTIRSKLDSYQELNDSQKVIPVMSDLVEGYNNSVHSSLGKSPNEMTMDDVIKNAEAKREHNNKIMKWFYQKAADKNVKLLTKKNVFDKGANYKLSKDKHKIVNIEDYNFVLDNGRKHPPKDRQIMKG
jgi:hypothetical protein